MSVEEGEIQLYESDILPNDAIYYIFEFCCVQDIVMMVSVSKRWSWSKVAKSEHVWLKRFEDALEISSVRRETDRIEEISSKKTSYEKIILLKRHEKDFKNRHYIFYVPSIVKKPKRKGLLTHIKLVVVGDHNVGKTCLLVSHTSGSFPDSYIPTVFDNYCANVRHNDEIVSLGLWDSAGHWVVELKKYCPDAPIVVCATKIDLRRDGENLKSSEEKIEMSSDMKIDEDDSEKETRRFIDYSDGYNMAENVGASAYFETSAKNGIGLDVCFSGCLNVALGTYVAKDMSLYVDPSQKKKKDACKIM